MQRYLRLSRTHSYSLLFAIPLLLLYEAGALWLARSGAAPLRNGADVLLRALLALGGVRGTIAVSALLIAASGVLIAFERRRHPVPLRAGVFAGMLAESTALALALGMVVGTATQWLLDGMGLLLTADAGPVATLPLREAMVLSLGAGIYEELVFRVLLVGGFAWAFRASGFARATSGWVAALLAAAIFSAFHYVGPYADAWALPSFAFRFLAGLVFSALFLLRGFGIAAWTHALYDLFLFVLRGGG